MPHMGNAPNLQTQTGNVTKPRRFNPHIDKSLERPQIHPPPQPVFGCVPNLGEGSPGVPPVALSDLALRRET